MDKSSTEAIFVQCIYLLAKPQTINAFIYVDPIKVFRVAIQMELEVK